MRTRTVGTNGVRVAGSYDVTARDRNVPVTRCRLSRHYIAVPDHPPGD